MKLPLLSLLWASWGQMWFYFSFKSNGWQYLLHGRSSACVHRKTVESGRIQSPSLTPHFVNLNSSCHCYISCQNETFFPFLHTIALQDKSVTIVFYIAVHRENVNSKHHLIYLSAPWFLFSTSKSFHIHFVFSEKKTRGRAESWHPL